MSPNQLQGETQSELSQSKKFSRRSLLQSSLLLPAGLVGSSSLLAACGILTSGNSGTANKRDSDYLINQAVGNELALIQAIGAANYPGNTALEKEFNALIQIHTEHALALNPKAQIGPQLRSVPKQSPTQALSKVRAAQRQATHKQKALALQAEAEELAFQLAIICASEAECTAQVTRIKP